jgi:hypothetical protein
MIQIIRTMITRIDIMTMDTKMDKTKLDTDRIDMIQEGKIEKSFHIQSITNRIKTTTKIKARTTNRREISKV